MSQRSKNNSVIFLTTLSVYLGLVLVGGATSPVLAQTNLTIKSEIRNRTERRDDFPFLFAQLLGEIKKEVENGKIHLPIQSNFHVEFNFEVYFDGTGYKNRSLSDNGNLSFLVQREISEKFEAKINQLVSYVSKIKRGKIKFEANDTDLSIKISFSKLKAEQFANFTKKEFSLLAGSERDFLNKQLYKNTEIFSENNQVFIVTRLPRGSLDELLKQDVKAS